VQRPDSSQARPQLSTIDAPPYSAHDFARVRPAPGRSDLFHTCIHSLWTTPREIGHAAALHAIDRAKSLVIALSRIQSLK
jgi:hypothetical protein